MVEDSEKPHLSEFRGTVSVSIRLLSHNIRYATKSRWKGEEPWKVRRSKIASELLFVTRHCPAAFICLQEALHHQLLDILTALNGPSAFQQGDGSSSPEWSYIGVGRDDGEQAGEYSPILYRPAVWRLEESKAVWLSETPDRPSKSWDAACVRILTVGLFQHVESNKWLLAMNTHLDHRGAKSRLEAARLILREIGSWSSRRASIGHLPVFLSGDLNSPEDDDAYKLLNEDESPIHDLSDWIDPSDRYGNKDTFTGFGQDDLPHNRIDFLFLGPKPRENKAHDDEGGKSDSLPIWRTLSYAVLPNRFDDGVYNSDHRAVVGDVLLE